MRQKYLTFYFLSGGWNNAATFKIAKQAGKRGFNLGESGNGKFWFK